MMSLIFSCTTTLLNLCIEMIHAYVHIYMSIDAQGYLDWAETGGWEKKLDADSIREDHFA